LDHIFGRLECAGFTPRYFAALSDTTPPLVIECVKKQATRNRCFYDLNYRPSFGRHGGQKRAQEINKEIAHTWT